MPLLEYHGILCEPYGCWIALGVVLLLTLLGYAGAPLIAWLIVGVGALFTLGAPLWLVYTVLGVGALFLITPIRKALISSQVMGTMKKLGVIPQISQTEKQALEAGVVWVESEFFEGGPKFKKMLAEPYPSLTAEEQAFIDGPCEELCAMMNDWEITQKRELPEEVWNYIKKNKFMGMIIPKEYGGLGFSALAHSAVIQKVSSRSVAGTITVMVPNSLGPAELLVHYGTQEQKDKLLPKLAIGEEVPCFALTEPGAGSDAGSIQSKGTVFKGDDGKLYLKLEWNKRWITLAAVSTTLGLAFRLFDPENHLGKGEDVGITCALIPTNTEGVVVGQRHDPLGVPFYNCPTQGKDVVVPIDAIIGGPERAGDGWMMLMDCLGAGRGISLPSQGAGGSKMATRVVGAHSVLRKQFGMSIGKFEGVEEPLARIGGFTYLLEALRTFTCGAIDKGVKPPVVTAIAKFNATEISRTLTNDAMDVLGGAGISRGPRNTMAHTYIALPIAITVEGANILTRTLMIFGQGALRAHPYAFKEVKALEEGNLGDFDKAFWAHIGHIVRNVCRSFWLSITRGGLASAPVGGPTAKYYKKLAWASASFAIMSDMAMGLLGGKLKLKEKLTGRFADILSWLYLSFAVLRRFEAEGRRPEHLPFVDFCLEYGLVQIQKAFDGIFTNFDVPLLGWFFKGPIAWWSRMNSLGSMSDTTGHKVAAAIQQWGEFRDDFTKGSYVPTELPNQIARLDQAFEAVHKAEAVEKKIKKAIRAKKLAKKRVRELIDDAVAAGVITADEKDIIQKSEDLRWDAIQVDDFTDEQFKNHEV